MPYEGDYSGGGHYGDPFALPLVGALGAKLARKVIPGLAKRAFGAVMRRPGAAAAAAGLGIAAGKRMMAPGRAPMRFPLPGPTSFQPRFAFPGGKSPFQPDECPKGYHINKAYRRWQVALQNGRNVKEPYWVNMCVSSRSIDFANPSALRRAARRGKSFVRMYRKFAGMFGARRGCATCAKRGRRR